VKSEIAKAIGRVYENLGDHARAIELYRIALDAARRVGETARDSQLVLLDRLANALEAAQDLESAAPLRREHLERAQRGEGGDRALAGALNGLAHHHAMRNEPDEAERLYRSVLAEKGGRFAPFPGLLFDAHFGVAKILRLRGRHDEVIPMLREAAAEVEGDPEGLGRKHYSVHVLLAHSLGDARRYEEALAVYQSLADTYLPRLDPDGRIAIEIRLYLAECLSLCGRLDESIAILADCLVHAREGMGEKHPDFGVVLAKYVEACTRAGRLDGLEKEAQELVDLQRALAGGRPDFRLGGYIVTLANVIAAKGEPRRAIPHYLECLDLIRKSMGIETVPGAHTLIFTLRAYVAAEAYEEALPLARESLGVQEKVLGKESANYAFAAGLLGTILLRTGDPAAAEIALRDARDRLRTLAPSWNDLALALAGLAEALAAQGRTGEAVEAAKEHVAFAEKNYAKGDPRLAAARKRLEELGQPGR
jgi:tetratricopeptide (TPR) repeat protein